MTAISLDENEMRALIAGVITSQMTSEKRDELVKNAIRTLLEPPQNRSAWDKPNPAPLAQIFEQCAYEWARAEVKRVLAEDSAMQEKIRSTVMAGIEKAFVGDQAQTVDKIASGITDALSKIRY